MMNVCQTEPFNSKVNPLALAMECEDLWIAKSKARKRKKCYSPLKIMKSKPLAVSGASISFRVVHSLCSGCWSSPL